MYVASFFFKVILTSQKLSECLNVIDYLLGNCLDLFHLCCQVSLAPTRTHFVKTQYWHLFLVTAPFCTAENLFLTLYIWTIKYYLWFWSSKIYIVLCGHVFILYLENRVLYPSRGGTIAFCGFECFVMMSKKSVTFCEGHFWVCFVTWKAVNFDAMEL